MGSENWDRIRELVQPSLHFRLPIPPASLQAKRKNQNIVREAIREHTRKCEFILTGDVRIEVTWGVHERFRYESHISPDIDNIIKPIFDALVGPEGILVDDGQVQSFCCSWIDTPTDEQWISISIARHFEDDWMTKDGFFFIHMGKGRCFPFVQKGIPAEASKRIIEAVHLQIETRDRLMRMGADYYVAQVSMSVQRLFSKPRVKGFQIMEYEAFLEMLLSSQDT